VTASTIIAAFYFTFLGALGCFWPYFGMHLESVGLSAAEATRVMSVWPLVGFLTPPLLGLVADARAARNTILCVVTGLAALSFCGFFFAHGLPALYATTALVALSRSSVLPMADAAALDAVRSDGGSYGRMRAVGSLGFLLMALGAGQLVRRWDTRAALAATVLLVLATLAVALRLPAAPAATPRRNQAIEAWFQLLKRADLWVFLSAVALAQVGNAIYDAGFSLHLKALGHGPGFVSAAWALGVGGEVGLMLVSARLIASVGAPWLFASTVVVACGRWVLLAQVTDPTALLCLAPLHGVSFGLFYVSAVTVMRDKGGSTPTAAQGLFAAAIAVGAVAGMNMSGGLLERHGGQGMFGVGAVSAALAAVVATVHARWLGGPRQVGG